jgi:hypothetical protein
MKTPPSDAESSLYCRMQAGVGQEAGQASGCQRISENPSGMGRPDKQDHKIQISVDICYSNPDNVD